MFIGFDPLYFVIIAPALILSLVASLLLNYWYAKYTKITNRLGVSGAETAKIISEQRGYNISLNVQQGKLTDNYNPFNKSLNLSNEVAATKSIASVAIAAHELGHVEQDFKSNIFLRLRNTLVPVVNFGSTLGYILIFAGILLSVFDLAWVGVALFSLTAVFSIVTIPVEIDASRRAMGFIKEFNLLQESEYGGARKVLTAAALTYIAALLSSLGNVLYYVLILTNMRGRD